MLYVMYDHKIAIGYFFFFVHDAMLNTVYILEG